MFTMLMLFYYFMRIIYNNVRTACAGRNPECNCLGVYLHGECNCLGGFTYM